MRALALLLLPTIGLAGEARLCVHGVVVAPVKAGGAPWDGPGKAAQAAGHVLQLAAETPEEKALTHAAPVLVDAIEGATAAPDLAVTLAVGRHPVVASPVREDTLRAAWSPVCVTATPAELAGAVIEVWDRDLQADDLVGTLVLTPATLPTMARTWQAGPFGQVVGLTLSYAPQAGVVALAQGQVRIEPDRVASVVLAAPGPGTLLLEWTVAGRKAGIAGAHDDALIGYRLHTVDGVELDRLGKHAAATRRIPVRSAGALRVVWSNEGWIRSSAREVSYRLRFEAP